MSRRLIYITAKEHAALIRLSMDHGPISTSFGSPSGTSLTQDEEGRIESAWALPYLAEWRGLTVNEGAGI